MYGHGDRQQNRGYGGHHHGNDNGGGYNQHRGGGGYDNGGGGGYRGGGGRGGRGGRFDGPRQSRVSAPHAGPIKLVTNNFRIKSQNHGIIYTYRVEFIEGHAAAVDNGSGSKGLGNNSSDDQQSKGSHTSMGQLETFQKYKIINAHNN